MTQEQIDFVIANYKTMAWSRIAKVLGLNSETPLNTLKRKLGLKRTRKENQAIISKSRFYKGQKPIFIPEKGTRNSVLTEFKKGHLPHNTKHDGCISIRTDAKTGRKYQYIRLSKAKWRELHRVMWEEKNGPIPSGLVIKFLNGNTLDCRIENLSLITRRELALMNVNPAKTGEAMKKVWANKPRLKIKASYEEIKDYIWKIHRQLKAEGCDNIWSVIEKEYYPFLRYGECTKRWTETLANCRKLEQILNTEYNLKYRTVTYGSRKSVTI